MKINEVTLYMWEEALKGEFPEPNWKNVATHLLSEVRELRQKNSQLSIQLKNRERKKQKVKRWVLYYSGTEIVQGDGEPKDPDHSVRANWWNKQETGRHERWNNLWEVYVLVNKRDSALRLEVYIRVEE